MSTFLKAPKRDVKRITNLFPIKFKNYFDPFLNSGDIFFSLFSNGRIFDKAYLSSSDSNLIKAYIAVRDEPERLQKILEIYCEKNSKEFYDNMLRAVAAPSAYIYINRAGNMAGEWRESQFIDRNQKISKYFSDIERCSRYLTRWCQSIRNIDWEQALMGANEGDVVWLEPPKIIATADGSINFPNRAWPKLWPESAYVYINNYCKQLAKKGVKVFMLQSTANATFRIYGHSTVDLGNGECLFVY